MSPRYPPSSSLQVLRFSPLSVSARTKGSGERASWVLAPLLGIMPISQCDDQDHPLCASHNGRRYYKRKTRFGDAPF